MASPGGNELCCPRVGRLLGLFAARCESISPVCAYSRSDSVLRPHSRDSAGFIPGARHHSEHETQVERSICVDHAISPAFHGATDLIQGPTSVVLTILASVRGM